jgi:hypothetical protein
MSSSNLSFSLTTGIHQTFLASWSRVLSENLIVTHVVKKFPIFYGAQKFITVFIIAHSDTSICVVNIFLFSCRPCIWSSTVFSVWRLRVWPRIGSSSTWTSTEGGKVTWHASYLSFMGTKWSWNRAPSTKSTQEKTNWKHYNRWECGWKKHFSSYRFFQISMWLWHGMLKG